MRVHTTEPLKTTTAGTEDLNNSFGLNEILALYDLPLPELIHRAQTVHKKYFPMDEVQLCTLLSVKTGGCKEDCGYCPQSAHHKSDIAAHRLLPKDEIINAAKQAKANGATRFCMGAAWRSPPKKGKEFNDLLDAVRGVHSLGLEVCTTLGMLDEEQARALKEAGVYAYNHNIDTSPEYYSSIISTRQFEDRLKTLENVRKAGMTVCCGGIIGMGETRKDRARMLEVLHKMSPQPESVPINMLVAVKGTPLEKAQALDVFELVKTIAISRILLPKSRVRLSAGRAQMSDETQALCFIAGANSIFLGEKLLTTKNPDAKSDHQLLKRLNMRGVTDTHQGHSRMLQ